VQEDDIRDDELMTLDNRSFGNVIKGLQNRFSAWVLGPFDCIM